MKPTIGRIVHLKLTTGDVVAGIITRVDDDILTLTLFHPHTSEVGAWVNISNMAPGLAYAEAGQWFWPERG